MTNRMRWLEIADACAMGDADGICFMWPDFGGSEMYNKAGKRPAALIGPVGPRGYLSPEPFIQEGADVRCLFACLMAAMTDKERAEVEMP